MTVEGTNVIRQADGTQASLIDFYSDVANQLNTKVFLWGALVQALVLELNEGNISLLKSLAEKTTDNRLLRSALVEALVRFGEGNRDQAKEFIIELIGQLTPRPKNFFGELVRLLRPIHDLSLQDQPVKAIAINAAARLEIIDLLEDLATEPLPGLRNLAAQGIFLLWKNHPHRGIQILDSLSNRVRQKWLPDLGVSVAVLSIIGVILSEEHGEETSQELLRIGRKALRRILYLNLDQNSGWAPRVGRMFLGILYNLIIYRIFNFVLWLLDNMRQNAVVPIEGLGHVFDLSDKEKRSLLAFIPFVNPDTPGLRNRVDDMINFFEWGDFYTDAVLGFSILGRGVLNFEETLSIVKELTGNALRTSPPRFWIAHPCWTLFLGTIKLKEPKPDFMEVIEKVCIAVQEDPEKFADLALKGRRYPSKTNNRVNFLGVYVAAHYEMMKETHFPLLIKEYLDKAVQSKDTEYLQFYIRQELWSMFDYGFHRAAILGLEPIAFFEDEKTREAVIELLLRARNHDPYFLEDLLLKTNFPEEIVNRVLAEPTEQRFTDLFTDKIIPMMYDLFILGPVPLRIEFQWSLSQALLLRNMRVWLLTVIRELINAILGEQIFSVPPDAPSRQILKGGKIQ